MTAQGILAIDLGTSGLKAGMFIDGVLSAAAAEPVRTEYPREGWAEQDPEQWWSSLVRVVRSVLVSITGTRIASIALCGQSDSLVPIDAAGRAVHPCILWMDRRGAQELDEAMEIVGFETIRRRTGLRPGVNFTAPKAAWLARHRPDAYVQTRWLVQPKDALMARMIDRVVTDPSSAARTLLYDLDKGVWSSELVEAFGLDIARLPPVVASAVQAGTVTPVAARELGLPVGIPVVAGAADRAAEALGIALGNDDTMVSTGTSTGIVRVMAGARVLDDPAVITPAHAIPGERLAILSQPTSGAVLDWFATLVRADRTATTLEDDALSSPPGANGVTALPHFMGARSIRWDPSARGSLHGLTLATSRGDVAKAIAEGVAFEVNACRARLDAMLGPTGRLILAGGGHRANLWAQTLVDVLGLPGIRYADDDASLVGAMLLAASTVGTATDLRTAAAGRLREASVYRPDSAHHATYLRLTERYEALYRAVNQDISRERTQELT